MKEERKKPVDELGQEETARIYTFEVKAIVSSKTTGTRVWEKDFYVCLPPRIDLLPGSERGREKILQKEIAKWVRTFNRRKLGRQIRIEVTDENGRRLPEMDSISGKTN